MKFLDCWCSRARPRHPPSQQNQPSSPGRPSPSPSPSPTHNLHNAVIIEPGQAEDLATEKPATEEPVTEEPVTEEPPTEEDISTVTADGPFRPILRRGIRYSAEALRRNGAVRVKSVREPPTSARDIYWIENSSGQEEMQENENKQQKRISYTPAIPPASWSRFPSHTRAERSCSSAGKEDAVYVRDFAFEVRVGNLSGGDKAEEEGQGSGRKYRRHTFEKSMARKLHRYHSASLRPTRSGFRSSVSIGGVLEYPELAILPSLEAIPLVSRADVFPRLVLVVDDDDDDDNPASKNLGTKNSSNCLTNNSRDAADGGARAWSQIYEGCLLPRPTTSDEMSIKGSTNNAFLRPEDGSRHSRQSSQQSSRQLSEHRRLSPRCSTEMRSSTVDFQKSLEEYEVRARERALQAASDASLRRPKEVS